MKEDVRLYVMRCDIWAADKELQKPPKAAMGHIRSGAPWDTLAIDYLGPFPETPRQNK
jgi:hypothetical protein